VSAVAKEDPSKSVACDTTAAATGGCANATLGEGGCNDRLRSFRLGSGAWSGTLRRGEEKPGFFSKLEEKSTRRLVRS